MTIEPAYFLALLAGAGGVIAILFRMLIASKDKEFATLMANMEARLKDAENSIKTYKEVASEAIKSAVETTNHYRAKEGKPPLLMPPAVVPEGNSPATEKQMETATAATYRASMAYLKRLTGQEPRKEPGSEHPQAHQQVQAEEVREMLDKSKTEAVKLEEVKADTEAIKKQTQAIKKKTDTL